MSAASYAGYADVTPQLSIGTLLDGGAIEGSRSGQRGLGGRCGRRRAPDRRTAVALLVTGIANRCSKRNVLSSMSTRSAIHP